MNTKSALLGNKTRLAMGALAATVLLAGTVRAGNTFTVKVKVNTAGLDLRHEAGARELYSRLKNAADAVCNNAYRVGLQPVADYADCYEKALGDAVQSVDQPQLTQVYLQAHTLEAAAAHGVKVSLLASTERRQ